MGQAQMVAAIRQNTATVGDHQVATTRVMPLTLGEFFRTEDF